ncbi:MAG: carboxymuconolactone decarboxylase family protein [Candidatus Limivicinus sp.]|jgi:AhpD family alkylhydroperoxidase
MSGRRIPKGKKLYSIFEIYGIAVKAFRSAGDMKRGLKSGIMSRQLQERIMLAVTAVNNCPMCSYAHTQMALEAGLSEEEIKSLTAGEFPDLPENEIKAVLFAQHYADSRGKPSKQAWEELIREYGEAGARSVLAAARIIMFGNSMGIVFSSIKGRFSAGQPDSRSSIIYELGVILCLIPIIILSLIESLICGLFKLPVIRFPD